MGRREIESFGYARLSGFPESEALSGLRSLTGSSGTHTETLVGYEKVPHELEAEIIAEAQTARA